MKSPNVFLLVLDRCDEVSDDLVLEAYDYGVQIARCIRYEYEWQLTSARRYDLDYYIQ